MENTDEECMELINQLYQVFEPNMGKLIHLELVTDDYCNKDDFLSQMKKLHTEIRHASTNRFRYFVNMKLSKLKKDIVSEIPLSEYLNMLNNETCNLYWKTIHQIYVLLEYDEKDKNEPYINTIISEIARRDTEIAIAIAEEEQNKKALTDRAEKRLMLQQEKNNLPNIDEFLKQLDENPEMMATIASMTGQSMSTKDMKKTIQQAMKENPKIINMLQNAMNMGENGNMDIMGMIEQFVPNLDMNCHTNIVLVNKIFNDLMYIFEGDSVKERMKEKIHIYRDLITHERISVNEMIACLWKISSDDKMFTAIKNINTNNLNTETLMSVALEFIPPEMVSQFGDFDALKAMFVGGDMGPLTDVMKMFKKDMHPDVEEQLTEDQLKELEDYYNEII